ncbi:MAG: hypothetical protein M1840_003126 [Geoglossum simile]|nr:MAG: hypothetical protein M1840_003126 [Geoglossum simile]
MATPVHTRLRAGPITPGSTRNRRSQPPDAGLPVLDTAQNRLYGSSIPVLPDDSETGSRLAHGSLARNMARTRGATSVRSVRSEQVTQDRDRDERQSNRELIREGSVASRASKTGTRKGRKKIDAVLSLDDPALPEAIEGDFVPLMSGGLGNPPPRDGERSPTGGTASKTWGQETGINAHAVTGMDHHSPLRDIRGVDTATHLRRQAGLGKGNLGHSLPHADLSDHGGLLDFEDSEESGDEVDFPRNHQSRAQQDTRPWFLWRFVLFAVAVVLVLWGAIRSGIIGKLESLRFSLPTSTNYITPGSTGEIIREINTAISHQLSGELFQNISGDIKGMVVDIAHIKESQKHFALNETVEAEFEKIYQLIAKLSEHTIMHDESIETLRSILPDLTWVSRSSTGDIVIQQDFWLALRSKIERELGGAISASKDTDLWDRFLELNESRMRPYIASAADEHIQKASDDGVLITKEHFLSILQANSEKHSREMRKLTEIFGEKYRAMEHSMAQISKDVERKVAVTAIQKVEALRDRISRTLPAAQLEALVQANVDRNSQQALTSINYFSPGMGASIDPRGLSGTYSPPQGWASWFFRLFVPMATYRFNEPIAALYSWGEPQDCWCASNKSDPETLGNAQFGVTIATYVYPTDITVEHIPRTAVPSVQNAPKDIELWMNIPNETLYDSVKEESEGLLGLTPPRGTALAKSWLRIGAWRYTPYGVNHVLNFPLQIDLKQMGAPGREFMIRATTNWDATFTCFYRIRMGGKMMETIA